MPSFPTSVFAPSAKTTGQTIQASHINDLQDEVVAIEGGYLNGTAPLNSSNSTVANLSVPGASTFAARPVMPPPDVARLGLDVSLAIAANSTTPISWTKEVVITNSSLHSTGTNPQRITPQSTGIYRFRAQVRWQNSASTAAYVVFIEDSSGGRVGTTRWPTGLSGGIPTVAVDGMKRFDVTGGWVQVVAIDGVSTNSLSTQSDETYFEVVKL